MVAMTCGRLEQPPLHDILRAHLRRSLIGRAYYRHRRRQMADVYVLSFPKVGRTWLRVMLGKAITLAHGIETDDVMELDRLVGRVPGLPRVRFKHDDNPHFRAPHELVTRKTEYRDCTVILMARDIRDTLVSLYFQMTRREDRYRFTGTLDEFLRCPRGSTDTMIRFYNIWADQRAVPRRFHLARYEDLHADPAPVLRGVLEAMGVEGVSDDVLAQAVEYARFENMRKIEEQGAVSSSRLRPGDVRDPESYKVRKGRVGGYIEYLSPQQIEVLNHKVRTQLDPMYGYEV